MKKPKRKPILVETDQKYWRRRANQQVRRQRMTRKLIRWTGLFAANALMTGGIVFAAFEATTKLFGGPNFAIENVRVERVARASQDRLVTRLVHQFAGRNIFSVNLYEIERAAMFDPWIRAASIKRVLPRTIRVRVIERRPVAVALIDGVAHLVDNQGYVIGLTGGANDDLPVLTGLGGLEYEQLAAALSRGVSMLERLAVRSPQFADNLSELDLSEPAKVSVYMIGGGPRLLLDPEHVERNVSRWLGLRRAIQNRAGALEYVDLRWSQRIVVKPLRL